MIIQIDLSENLVQQDTRNSLCKILEVRYDPKRGPKKCYRGLLIDTECISYQAIKMNDTK